MSTLDEYVAGAPDGSVSISEMPASFIENSLELRARVTLASCWEPCPARNSLAYDVNSETDERVRLRADDLNQPPGGLKNGHGRHVSRHVPQPVALRTANDDGQVRLARYADA